MHFSIIISPAAGIYCAVRDPMRYVCVCVCVSLVIRYLVGVEKKKKKNGKFCLKKKKTAHYMQRVPGEYRLCARAN